MEYYIDKNRIKLTAPDSFGVLSEEEMEKIRKTFKPLLFAVRDDELRMVVHVCGIKQPIIEYFYPGMISNQNVIAKIKRSFGKSLLNYRFIKDIEAKIGGKNSFGFRFSYEDVNSENPKREIVAELHCIKHKRKYYVFCCLWNQKYFEVNYHFFEDILKSVKL